MSAGKGKRLSHKKRHEQLHNCLDELVADFIRHCQDRRPSNTTVLELMQWSAEQAKKPTVPK